jgi:hypothetical protein
MADSDLGTKAKLVAAAVQKGRPALTSLPDVDTDGLADGDTLVRDAAAGKWKRGVPAGGLPRVAITFGGSWTTLPLFQGIPPQGMQLGAGGSMHLAPGCWVASINTSDPGVTSLSFDNLAGTGGTGDGGGAFGPTNMAALTSLSAPVLVTVCGNFSPDTMAALTSLSAPALATVGNNFQPNSMPALTSLSAPVLVTVGGSFNPHDMAALTSLSAPALATVGSNFNPSNMAALTSLSLPALATVGGAFNPNTMAALTSLSLPALATVGGNFSPQNMAALTSLSLPAVATVGSGFTLDTGTDALASLTLNAGLRTVGGDVVFSSCALDQASVDVLLIRLAGLDGTGGTTSYDNHAVTITGTSATPGAPGLAAKAVLVARGNTVTTN